MTGVLQPLCLTVLNQLSKLNDLLYFVEHLNMNSRLSNENNENLEESQENQKKIGSAEKDPQTTGPSENLREEALEETDTENTDKEPA